MIKSKLFYHFVGIYILIARLNKWNDRKINKWLYKIKFYSIDIKQYCIGTWNVRSMNQGKLEVVKQEMARVNVNILGIRELR